MKYLLLAATMLVSYTAQAQTYTYTCKSQDLINLTLKVNTRTATLESQDPETSYDFKGKFDSSYTGSAEKVRYTGFISGAATKLVLTKQLLAGGLKLRNSSILGFVQIQHIDDGFSTTNYICFAK